MAANKPVLGPYAGKKAPARSKFNRAMGKVGDVLEWGAMGKARKMVDRVNAKAQAKVDAEVAKGKEAKAMRLKRK